MVGYKSHFGRNVGGSISRNIGRNIGITISLAVGIPAIAALAGSFFLGQQAFKIQDSQNEQVKTEEIRAQTRLLMDDIWAGVEGVKTRTQSYWLTRSQIGNRAVLDPQILAYARVTQDSIQPAATQSKPKAKISAIARIDQGPSVRTQTRADQGATSWATGTVKEVVKNPTWTRQVLGNLNLAIQTAARQVSTQSIHQSGASVIEIPKTQGQAGEYIAVAFYPSVASSDLVIAIVDPEQVFTSFSRWVTRRENGNLRSFLIGADGKVLVHSERVYSGSDFSNSQIYQRALQSLFRNERASGFGTFTAVDLRPVLTSYNRLGALPFAIVVERVVRPVSATVLRQILIPSMMLVAIVLILSLASMASLWLTRKNTVARKSQIVKVPELEPLLARVTELSGEREEIDNLKHQLQSALERFGHTGEMDVALHQDEPFPAATIVQNFESTDPTPEKEN
jgi:CHASE3 domain sensor protein